MSWLNCPLSVARWFASPAPSQQTGPIRSWQKVKHPQIYLPLPFAASSPPCPSTHPTLTYNQRVGMIDPADWFDPVGSWQKAGFTCPFPISPSSIPFTPAFAFPSLAPAFVSPFGLLFAQTLPPPSPPPRHIPLYCTLTATAQSS